MRRCELLLQLRVRGSHRGLIAQTIAKHQMVPPERTMDRYEIEVMGAVMFTTADEELALRQALWAASFVPGILENLEVRARLYSRLMSSYQIDDGFGRESGNCGAADVLKQKRREFSVRNALCEPFGFRAKGFSPCGICRTQLHDATRQSDGRRFVCRTRILHFFARTSTSL
jgi:hypothetical protein